MYDGAVWIAWMISWMNSRMKNGGMVLSLTPVRKRSIFLSAFALSLTALTPAFADSVRLANGEEQRGEVRKEAVGGVLIVIPGAGARNIARRDIAPDGVTLEGMPQPLREAREALPGRDFARAHTGFRATIHLAEAASGAAAAKPAGKNGKDKDKKAKAAPPGAGKAQIRSVFLQHGLYGEVQTFAEEGKADDAIKAVDELLAAVPDSWYFAEAVLLKIRLLAQKKNAAELTAAVEDAKKKAEAASVGPELTDRIELLLAESLALAGKPDEATKGYEKLSKSSIPAVRDTARLGLAQAQLAKGSLVDAKITFSLLGKESKDRSVLCGAVLGLADAQMQEMKGKKTIEGLQEALENYVRAAIVNPPDEGESTENVQAAYLRAGACAEELVQLLKEPKLQEAYKAQAREIYRELQSFYPHTEGAKKAEAAVKRLSAGR